MSKPKPASVTPKTDKTFTPQLPPCSIPYRWRLQTGRSVSGYRDKAQPRASWPLHRNIYVRILIFGPGAQGVMRWTERGHKRERAVCASEVCLVGASVPFELDWQIPAPLIMLYLEPQMVREIFGRKLTGLTNFGESFIALHDSQVLQWMHLLTRLGQPQHATERLYLECLSTVLSIHLLSLAKSVSQSDPLKVSRLSTDIFNRIQSFVTDHLSEKITLDQLAKVAALSRSHFVRLFKGTAGMSPYHYVLRLRVLRACELLRATEQRITDIGFAVGFNDVADFNHAFRKFMECSPRQFRRMSRPIFPV